MLESTLLKILVTVWLHTPISVYLPEEYADTDSKCQKRAEYIYRHKKKKSNVTVECVHPYVWQAGISG